MAKQLVMQPERDNQPAPWLSVSTDEISSIGGVLSGMVTFRDGQTAQWHLDQLGCLKLEPQITGYDRYAFETAIQKLLASMEF